MDYLQACKLRYYAQDNSEIIIKKVRKDLDPSITSCRHELLCIFNDMLTITPCCYWNKSVYTQTITQLNKIATQKLDITIDEIMIEHFLIGYHTYAQVSDIINDLSELNDSPAIKNRQYRIPTYISIVEGCLTNLFRFIALLQNQISEKDYSSIYKLSPLCEILNKNGFNLLTADIDINIRNAINHGGLAFKEDGKDIDFHYNENHRSVSCMFHAFEFDRLIERVYDTASAVILGACSFLNEHWDSISVDLTEKSFVPFCLFSMELSIPTIRCRYLSEIPDNKQLNIDIEITDSERTHILQTAIELAMLIFDRYNDYEKYFVSFSNERLQTSWVRFTFQEVYDMINKKREFTEVVTEATKRKDVIIFDPSTEELDLQEIKYFRFPNHTENNFKINHVADASLPDRKRLKCHLFIGDIDDKEEIVAIIKKSIQWLKTVRNVDSPTLHHKNGNIESDALYINVYRQDARRNKELFPSNENFVCFADYNSDGNTTLKCGGLPQKIWQQLYHEKIGQIDIAWREGKYTIRKTKKIDVNASCPCGSGKKFKKCCRGNGVYD